MRSKLSRAWCIYAGVKRQIITPFACQSFYWLHHLYMAQIFSHSYGKQKKRHTKSSSFNKRIRKVPAIIGLKLVVTWKKKLSWNFYQWLRLLFKTTYPKMPKNPLKIYFWFVHFQLFTKCISLDKIWHPDLKSNNKTVLLMNFSSKKMHTFRINW